MGRCKYQYFLPIKGIVTQNIFSLKTSPNGCIDLYSESVLQKNTLENTTKKPMFWFIFCGYFGPQNYISMRNQGTCFIVPKLCGAHCEGSITQQGAL